MSTIIYHNHHIIPKYRCEELGIDPDFDPLNIIRLTRLEHAQAHYERWLKHKDPRDLGAAQLLAEGEIDGIDTAGKNNPMYGKENKWGHHTEEAKKKMSKAMKGRKRPPRTKEHSENISKALLGYSHSDEARKNMSEAQRGTKKSAETRKKMSMANIGRKNPMFGVKRKRNSKGQYIKT